MPRALLATALAALAAVGGCASTRKPCAGPTCGAGYECMANVCEPEGTEPVPPASARVVPRLQSFAVLSRAGDRQPPATTLGGRRGDSLVFLEFDDSWKRAGEPVRAFLVLFPDESAPAAREGVLLEAFAVPSSRQSWKGQVLRSPRQAGPTVRALARGSAPVRFDVTPLLRGLDTAGHDGIAIVAVDPDENGDGTTLSLIGERGSPPLFEVYVQPPKAK